LALIAPPACAGCGAHAGAAEPVCASCRRELRWLGREPITSGDPPLTMWAPLAYDGAAQGVVRALKFRGATGAAAAMAAQIAANAPPGWLARPAQLVPVPLHPARARKRGYNQAALLAKALGERTELESNDCLERAGPRGTQVGRDRAQRLEGIAGTVGLKPGRAPPADRAIVVDDVITTGATVAACARALAEGGTSAVVAIGYARTPGR
jgi:ComF family protein